MMKRLLVQGDSELVINQMTGVYRTLHPNMKPLHEQACQLVQKFQSITFQHVGRELNERADWLCRQHS
jgi:ribonuclease HI